MKTRELMMKTPTLGEKFITLPGEELVFLQRKHVITLLLPSLSIIFLAAVFAIIAFSAFFILNIGIVIFVSFLFTILLITLTSISKLAIDWFFNFYVVTNRKIVEIKYAPLFLRETNKILLDQVRCTEIDARTDGILNEIFDVGDIIMTFDRPTHQEELVFENVRDPKKVEAHLESALIHGTSPSTSGLIPNQEIWVKPRESNKWTYSQEMPVRNGVN